MCFYPINLRELDLIASEDYNSRSSGSKLLLYVCTYIHIFIVYVYLIASQYQSTLSLSVHHLLIFFSTDRPIMYPSVILLATLMAFVVAESILMTEVFIIPIRPETFDWSPDGKKHIQTGGGRNLSLNH